MSKLTRLETLRRSDISAAEHELVTELTALGVSTDDAFLERWLEWSEHLCSSCKYPNLENVGSFQSWLVEKYGA